MINQLSANTSSTAVSPIPWVQRLTTVGKALWGRTARPVTQTTSTATNVAANSALLAVRTLLPADRADVVCLAVEGELGRATYPLLLETAVTHYQQGWRYLLLDLRQCTQIELSGYFALCNIARLYSGQPLLDSNLGWAALRTGAETSSPALGARVKVVAPVATGQAALTSNPLCQWLVAYPDWTSALSAFPGVTVSPAALAA